MDGFLPFIASNETVYLYPCLEPLKASFRVCHCRQHVNRLLSVVIQ